MPALDRTVASHEGRTERVPREDSEESPAHGRMRPVRSAMDIELDLMRAIRRRTAGRVDCLQVHIMGGQVVLRGLASSHHVVQLAIAGLFEALQAMDLDRPEHVELDMDVVLHGPTLSRSVDSAQRDVEVLPDVGRR